MTEDTATDELGEDAVMALAEHYRYLGCPQPVDPVDPEDCASVAAESVRFLAPRIAALVAQARADGATEERERIAAAIDAVDGQPAQAWQNTGTRTLRTQAYLDGFSDGLAEAVDVIRRSS